MTGWSQRVSSALRLSDVTQSRQSYIKQACGKVGPKSEEGAGRWEGMLPALP